LVLNLGYTGARQEPRGNKKVKFMEKGKRSYLHSAHGYRTPIQVAEGYYRNHTPHLNAA